MSDFSKRDFIDQLVGVIDDYGGQEVGHYVNVTPQVCEIVPMEKLDQIVKNIGLLIQVEEWTTKKIDANIHVNTRAWRIINREGFVSHSLVFYINKEKNFCLSGVYFIH